MTTVEEYLDSVREEYGALPPEYQGSTVFIDGCIFVNNELVAYPENILIYLEERE